MQTPDEQPASLLSPIGYSRNNSCGSSDLPARRLSCTNAIILGYCGQSQSISYYVATKHLTVETYQIILDRGWRRSGTLLYKPDLLYSCCAQYTLRLDSTEFHATKDQRQCINRLNKHILGDSYMKEAARRFPLSRDQARKRDATFDLVERIHEGEKGHLRSSHHPSQDPQPLHELQVSLEPDDYTDEKYEIFENYQRLVHHEPPSKISKKGFARFLCSSPLPRSAADGGAPQYGSFHHCYRIDGKLVAVGVLDLLPHCVSGVYFMYHESVQQHSLGKLGALREIALAYESGYRYWYSGFYIHSCKKMRYKADYNPQYLLDPETYSWDVFDDTLKEKLDKQKYVSLSRERSGTPYPAEAAYVEVPEISDPPPTTNHDNDDDDDDDERNEEEQDEQHEEEGEDAITSDESSPSEIQLPLFARNIPGIMSKEELLARVDLDAIKVRIGHFEAVTSDLVGWETSDVDNPRSMKVIFADLAAALGPEVIRDVIVVFE